MKGTHVHRHLCHGKVVASSYKAGIDPQGLRVVVDGEFRFILVGEGGAESVEEERVLEFELGGRERGRWKV